MQKNPRHGTSMASSIASPIISPDISMRSFWRSNSISTFCMLGRFIARFMTRIACLFFAQQEGDRVGCVEGWVLMRV